MDDKQDNAQAEDLIGDLIQKTANALGVPKRILF